MKTQLLISAVVLIGAAALSGQTRVEYGGTAFQFAGAGGMEYRVFGVAGIGNQVVTGRPFSATEERHSVQILGDGTHIETAETNRLFRDDQGRTRVERAGGNVVIFDPVAGFSAELIPSMKEVNKNNVMVRDGRVVAKMGVAQGESPDALRSKLAKLREELAQTQKQYTGASPRVAEIRKQITDTEKAMTGRRRRRWRVDDLKNTLAQPSSSTGFLLRWQAASVRYLLPPTVRWFYVWGQETTGLWRACQRK